MKKKLLILGAVILFLSSCTSYTCPTYSVKPVDKQQKSRLEQSI